MDVTKTLRYYAEIGLLQPSEIDPENGYRYYAIEQLEKMLFINRLKAYSFSLDEIKAILQSEEMQDDHLQLEKTITFHSKEEQMAFYKATDISCWVAGPTGVNTAGWGADAFPDGYGENRAAVLKRRCVEWKPYRIRKVGVRQHIRAKQMETAGSAIWVFMVD